MRTNMVKMVETLINGKWKIKLPEHRANRPQWDITNGGWEKARLDSISKTTKPGDIVYYVGAEEGDMNGLLAMWGAKQLMFEPNPLVWPNIKAIWQANNLPEPLLAFPGFAAEKTEMNGYKKLTPGFPECADGDITGEHGFRNLCEADGTLHKLQ